MRLLLTMVAAGMAMAAPAFAQTDRADRTAPPSASPPSARTPIAQVDGGDDADDIFVIGSRYMSHEIIRSQGGSARTTPWIGKLTSGVSVDSDPEDVAERDEVFLHCAKHLDPKLVREVVDTTTGDPTGRRAMIWLMQQNSTCYLGSAEYAAYGNALVVNRGAIFEHALATYAPNLDLSRATLDAPGVFQRYDQLQAARNRHSLPEDLGFFNYAACLVAAQPRIAVALTRSRPNSVGERSLEAALVDRSKVCLNGAKGIAVHPTFLRVFVDEAVYVWAAAVRDVTSLVPQAG